VIVPGFGAEGAPGRLRGGSGAGAGMLGAQRRGGAGGARGSLRRGVQRRTGGGRPRGGAAAAAGLWALDFDGVLCDSCGESSLSAWRAGAELWPKVFASPQAWTRKARVLREMRQVRPVVETGYENVVQVRLLLEGLLSPEDMLDTWGAQLPKYMREWGLDRGEIVELFGRVRDDWMKDDLPSWLEANRFYKGVPEALKATDAAGLYIVTTKQARFAHALLTERAGVDTVPLDRIFSMTTSGLPKTTVLEDLQSGAAPGEPLRFVEDKLSALEKVCAEPALDAWELFFVDWGYNTPAEREKAAMNPRIRLIGLEEFNALLRDA